MTLAESGLRYIADSPPQKHGGFNPETVRVAKAALRLIARLRRKLAAEVAANAHAAVAAETMRLAIESPPFVGGKP